MSFMENNNRTGHLLALTLIALTVVVVFIPLGRCTLWNIDEARFAEGARGMIERGDCIVPMESGEVIPYYPPLTYWLIALFSLVMGGVTEFSARLHAALALLGCVLLTYSMGKSLFDRATGFVAALILLTTFGFCTKALALADMLMVFFVMLALNLFLLWYRGEKTNRRMLSFFYVALGLAVLSKGPQAIVLTGIVIIPYLAVRRDLRTVRSMNILLGIVILACIALPWYIVVSVKEGGDFIRRAIGENIDNFFSGECLMHVQPWYYYLKYLIVEPLPWTLFLPSSLVLLLTSKDERIRDARWFLVFWYAGIAIFYSLATSKRFQYLLPLYPAHALIVAFFWTTFMRKAPESLWRRFACRSPFAVLLLAAVIAPPALVFFREKLIARIPESTPIDLYALMLACIGVGIAFLGFLSRMRSAFVALVALLTVACALYAWEFRPATNLEGFRGIEFCRRMTEIVGKKEIVSYRITGPYFSLYANRTIRNVGRDEIDRYLDRGIPLCILADRSAFEADERLKERFVVRMESGDVYRQPLLLAEIR